MSFQIEISSKQRDYIVRALRYYEDQAGQPAPDSAGEYLTSMFADLKDNDDNYFIDEADGKRKNMLYGFCL